MQESDKNSSPPDALERIFQGPLNWVNLTIIGINILVFVVLELVGDTQNTEFMMKCGAAYTPWILEGEWYRLITSMFLHFGLYHLLNNMALLLFFGGVFVILLKNRGRIEQMTASRLLFVIVLTIYHGFQSAGVDNAAHIGGVLGGALLTALLYRRRTISQVS